MGVWVAGGISGAHLNPAVCWGSSVLRQNGITDIVAFRLLSPWQFFEVSHGRRFRYAQLSLGQYKMRTPWSDLHARTTTWWPCRFCFGVCKLHPCHRYRRRRTAYSYFSNSRLVFYLCCMFSRLPADHPTQIILLLVMHWIAAWLHDERFRLLFRVPHFCRPHVYGVGFWRFFKHAGTSWIVPFGLIRVDSGHWHFAWNADRYASRLSDHEHYAGRENRLCD